MTTDPKPERRGYFSPEGKRYPSVTTIIGAMLAKPALIDWGYRKGVEAMADEMMARPPRTPPVIDETEAFHDFMEEWTTIAADRAKAAKVHNKQRDAAGDAGTVCHAMIEAFLKNEPRTNVAEAWDDAETKARTAYTKWLRWFLDNDPMLVASETLMVDHELGIGGTLDGVLVIRGRVVLADWKTGKRAYDETVIQIGGYRHLWEKQGGRKIEGGVIVNPPIDTVVDGKVFSPPLVEHVLDMVQIDAGTKAFLQLTDLYKSRSAWALKDKRGEA